MKEHIHSVVGRYKGKIKVWDVVNEAISDGGPDMLRKTPVYRGRTRRICIPPLHR